MQGANYLAFKTDGGQRVHARAWGKRLWFVVVALSALTTVFAFFVRPGLAENFLRYPVLIILPAGRFGRVDIGQSLPAAGAGSYGDYCRIDFPSRINGVGGASLYPMLLPMLGHPGQGLSIFNSAAPRHNLETALAVNIVMMSIVIAYNIYIHRVFLGTVRVGGDEHAY